MLSTASQILTEAILPVLAIIAFGFFLQRFRPLESNTMVTLNLYFFVPVYIFVRVAESSLAWLDIGHIGVVVLIPIVGAWAVAHVALRRSSMAPDTAAAVIVGGTFFNAGNFGVPVAELAFGADGGVVHAVVLLFGNFCIFSLAFGILAMGKGHGISALLNYFRLPYFYMIFAALLVRDLRIPIPEWFMSACHVIANGLVPIALATLGSQLASRARWPHWRIVSPIVMMKLALMPALSMATVWLFGLWPWPGVVIVLAAAAPTAINPLLLAMQLDGDTDTLSDCIFWTTLCSAISVSIWLTLLRTLSPESFANM